MQTSTQAVRARTDEPFLERFIEAHEAFVLRCASRHAGFAVTRSDDEYSVALLAFYEAIKGYDPASGPFGAYASLVIGRRLADHYRSQHRFDAETPLAPQTFDGTVDRESADAAMQQAVAEQMSEAKHISAQEEIEAANTVFEKYGFAFYDLAASSPKSDKTRRSCAVAVGTLAAFAGAVRVHAERAQPAGQGARAAVRRVRADDHPSPGLHCSGGAAHRRRLPHPLHLSADHAQGGRAMRAIITDIRAGKAAVLAEDGTVHLVDAKNRAVGQEIRIPAKHRRRWKKPLTWAACVAVLCGMATTGVYAAYELYASVSVVGGTDSVEYTVNRFNQVLGTRVSGKEQPTDSKIPRFVHIDKAVEHTVRQEAKEGERVSITVTSRSSCHAERLREHIDDRFRQSGDERNPPEVRVQPPQDTGNAPEESRPSESTEQA